MNNKKYNEVYFRIDTPSYYKSKYGVGFENEQESATFHETAKNLFLQDGWEIKKEKYNHGCTTVIKDKQELYLHPQSFSGVVAVENISYIEKLINADIFKFEKTDIYNECFDVSDDEYINIFEAKQEEIEKEILKEFKTKRRDLYTVYVWEHLIDKVMRKYKVLRLCKHSGCISSSDIDVKWFYNLFEKLVKENKILTAETKKGTGYRTATKKDVLNAA